MNTHHVLVRLSTMILLASTISVPTIAAPPSSPSPDSTEKPVAPSSNGSIDLDEIIVTAQPVAVAKMASSTSVSTLGSDQIELAVPISTADVLRSIPGVHSEASAGEGNSNVTVRGIPISAGGFRYLTLQEDGLPVLLNGDYNFITPDMYVKLDDTLDHVEAVRGGSSSILASNSPGGIINFISKSGNKEGGSISLSKGLGYDDTRVDFGYGQHFTDQTRFFAGGFYRQGDGPRNGDVPLNKGGQIKLSVTHDIGDAGSFLRVTYKHLDDQSALNMPVDFNLSNANPTKANPATISEKPGVDPRVASYYSPYWPKLSMRTANNNLSTDDLNNGLRVYENALTLVAHFALSDDWVFDDSLRHSTKSGWFDVGYPTGPSFAQAAGSTYTYAAGPNKGKVYTGNVIELAAFDTSLDDLSSYVNALRISKTFDFSSDTFISPIFGWDLNNQTIHVNQSLPHYLFTATGNQDAPLVGTNSAGTATTDSTGLLPIANGWGTAGRQLQYDMSSPYAALSGRIAALNFDLGVRRDREKVYGWQSGTGATGGSTYVPSLYNAIPDSIVHYSVSHTSYSLGGNYRITNDFAVFARYSDGVAFNVPERISSVPLDGSAAVPVNTVKQTELGVKFRAGGFESFVTLFDAKTAEGNYDVTTRITSNNQYDAKGAEMELGYTTGGFNVNGSVTYTHARITGASDPTQVGDEPHRLAKYIYQISPSYTMGMFKIGGSLIGTDKSFGDDANTIIQPSYYTVNLFTSLDIGERATVSLSANNLTNMIGWTEYDAGQGARSINGRTVFAKLKYRF